MYVWCFKSRTEEEKVKYWATIVVISKYGGSNVEIVTVLQTWHMNSWGVGSHALLRSALALLHTCCLFYIYVLVIATTSFFEVHYYLLPCWILHSANKTFNSYRPTVFTYYTLSSYVNMKRYNHCVWSSICVFKVVYASFYLSCNFDRKVQEA